MGTVIKVKRKITEDPVECLILECKKKKLNLDTFVESTSNTQRKDNDLNFKTNKTQEENKLESIKQVLKYVGSAYNEKEVSVKLAELSAKIKIISEKKDPKAFISSNLKDSKLKRIKKEIKHQRYILFNQKRDFESIKSEIKQDTENNIEKYQKANESDEQIDKKITNEKLVEKSNLSDLNIIDVISSEYFTDDNESPSLASKSNELDSKQNNLDKENKITCNGVELIREKLTSKPATAKKLSNPIELDKKSNEYVYDIYFTKSTDIHLDLLYPNNYEIKSCNNYDDLVLLDDNLPDETEEIYSDDEDSNEESNWRNDYPDEEDDDEEDIDDENDIYESKNRRNKTNDNYDDFDDNYDEYDLDYNHDENEDRSKRLSSYMKKCSLDRSYYLDENSEDDFDEYDAEMPKSYSAYKKRLLKELENDG